MSALVLAKTIDSSLFNPDVRARKQAVYCTVELCLSVDKLKEEGEKRKERCLVYRSNVYVVFF